MSGGYATRPVKVKNEEEEKKQKVSPKITADLSKLNTVSDSNSQSSQGEEDVPSWEEGGDVPSWEEGGDVEEEERGFFKPILGKIAEQAGTLKQALDEGIYGAITSPIQTVKKLGGAVHDTISAIPEAVEGAAIAGKDLLTSEGRSKILPAAAAASSEALPGGVLYYAVQRAYEKAASKGKTDITKEELDQAYQEIQEENRRNMESSPLISTAVDVLGVAAPSSSPIVSKAGKGLAKMGEGALEAGYQAVKKPIVAAGAKGVELGHKGIGLLSSGTRPYLGSKHADFRQELAKLEGRPETSIRTAAGVAADEVEDILATTKEEISTAKKQTLQAFKKSEKERAQAHRQLNIKIKNEAQKLKQASLEAATKKAGMLDELISKRIDEVGGEFIKSIKNSKKPFNLQEAGITPVLTDSKSVGLLDAFGKPITTGGGRLDIRQSVQGKIEELIGDVKVRDETTRQAFRGLTAKVFDALPDNPTNEDIIKALFNLRGKTFSKFIPHPTIGPRFAPEAASAIEFRKSVGDLLEKIAPGAKKVNESFAPLYNARNTLHKSAFEQGISLEKPDDLIPSHQKIIKQAEKLGSEYEPVMQKHVGRVVNIDDYLGDVRQARAEPPAKIPFTPSEPPDVSTPTLTKQLKPEFQKLIKAVEEVKDAIHAGLNDAQVASILKDKLEKAGAVIGKTPEDQAVFNLLAKHGDIVSDLLNKKIAGETLDQSENKLVDRITRWSLHPSSVSGTAITQGLLPAAGTAATVATVRAARAATRDPLQALHTIARSEQQAKQAWDNLTHYPKDLIEIAKQAFTEPTNKFTGVLIEALSRGASPVVIGKIIQDMEEENNQRNTGN